MKRYYSAYEDCCTTIKAWKEYMRENNIKELELTEAEIDYNTGYFYCIEYDEIGESGEGCGTICEHYNPRNGKNGICKNWRNTYSATDKAKIIKL